MNLDGVDTGKPSRMERAAHGKEMSARIGIAVLFVVLAACMSFVGWNAFTRF